MSPEVTAAIIVGCFGVLTLIGTVIAQIIGPALVAPAHPHQMRAQAAALFDIRAGQSVVAGGL